MRRLLLVADGSWVANEIRSSLTLGDWDIEELHDPHLTAARVEESKAEAVVVDMQVGNMGGMAVIREIRQNFDGGERPRTVLLLDRAADEFIGRRAGADATVTKPITASELREALEETELSRSKPSPRSAERATRAVTTAANTGRANRGGRRRASRRKGRRLLGIGPSRRRERS